MLIVLPAYAREDCHNRTYMFTHSNAQISNIMDTVKIIIMFNGLYCGRLSCIRLKRSWSIAIIRIPIHYYTLPRLENQFMLKNVQNGAQHVHSYL